MTGRRKRTLVLCCALAIALTLNLRLAADQQATPTSAAGSTAEIDALLRRAGDQMHVTTQLKDAEETAKKALDLSRKTGDRVRTMRALHAVASVYFYVGRFTESLAMERECLSLAREIGDKRSLSVALNGEASALRALGRFEDALTDFEECASIARELGDLPLEWTITRNIGVLYVEMGDPDRAEAPLKNALRMAGDLAAPQWKTQVPDGGKLARAASMETLGTWEVSREHLTTAADYYERALAEIEVPAFVAEILSNLGAIRGQLGESAKAIELLERATRIWASTGAPPHPIMISDLASAQEAAGKIADARAGQEQALTLVHDNGGNPEYEWLVQSRLAHVDRALGHRDAAIAEYESAAHAVEMLRPSALGTEAGRAFTFAGRQKIYEEAADLLHDLGRDSEVFEFAERGRARAFLDVLAESRTGLATSLTPEEQKTEDAIAARLSAAQQARWKRDAAEADRRRADAAITAAEQELEAFRLNVKRRDPRYASVEYPEPAPLRRIQAELLDASTCLIEYRLGDARSTAWVVTQDKVSAFELPSRQAIDNQVAAYLKRLHEPASALTVRQSMLAIGESGAALFRSVFQPLTTAIGRTQKLIVVPDGGLNYLPFEALVTAAGRTRTGEPQISFLAEAASIVYGPSASALLTVRDLNRQTTAPSSTIAAFADPDNALAPGVSSPRGFSLERLPFAREEVLAIGRLFPAGRQHLYLGRDASEDAIKSPSLGEYRYLHVASHGFLDEMKPMRSGLLFSRAPKSADDGILQVGEIMRLKLNADLVTLSACSTGLGKMINGEGVLGLTRAMFYAGARNVVVSLWNVNDTATATLMTSLYRNLQRSQPPADAIRQAKIAMIRGTTPAWRHPYFWAAFILEGEGR